MQSRFLFMIMALILGAILPLQAAINARLSKTAGSPVMAALFLLRSALSAYYFLFVTRQFNLQWIISQRSPWWVWVGGLLGTFFVAGIVILLPRLGVALAFSLVIAGQMLAAMIFDQFGWLGVSIREISFGKIAGAILLIAGVVLIRKF